MDSIRSQMGDCRTHGNHEAQGRVPDTDTMGAELRRVFHVLLTGDKLRKESGNFKS